LANQIIGQDAVTLLKTDSVSGAARVTLYTSAGNELKKMGAGYAIAIPFMVGGTPAANSTLLAFRNLGTKKVRIRKILLNVSFNGTAAATTQSYELRRFTTATPTGGTAITVIKKRNSAVTSTVTDARFGGTTQTALTVTGVVFESPWAAIGQQRQVGSSQSHEIIFSDPEDGFEIDVNEGFCIRNAVTGVAGDGLAGMIEWEEV